MPSRGDTQINTFVGGLITEASPLSFPPNSSIDEVNFKLKRDGSRERRLGLDYEVDYALVATGLTAEQLKVSRQRYFHWPTPNGNTDVDIGIAQIGGLLFFMDMFTANPSANLLNGGAAYDTGLTGNVIINFTIINNKVVVVSSGLDTPFLLSYNKDTDTVSAITAQLQIRDLYGVTDGFTVDNRPTTLSAAHEYNLRNQGWDDGIVTVTGTEVLQDTFNSLGVYPSNSDTWSLGKIADVTDADVDKYEPQTLSKNSFDIGRAARGHFIIELYNRGASRTTESGIAVPSSDRELGRISTVESYAGRLFYSGITSRTTGSDELSPNLSGAVLYSQIARSDADLVKCYQDADPTSPTSNDQVDTDGGVIQVAGAVDIVKLMTVKTSLFVFASNGVWQIRGDESGFRPTSFQVNKISSIGVFSPESIVEANGTIFFWAKSGIYSLTPNQVDSTTFDTTNITISTIQRGYNSLPDLVKKASKGFYDLNENTIRWLYKSDVPETLIVPDPDPAVFQIGEPVTGETLRLEPKVAMVNATTALIITANSTVRRVYYQVATINTSTLAVTLGTEVELVDGGSNGAIRGWAVERLSDDRVVVITSETSNETKARLVTFSAGTPTVGSPTVINSVFGPVVTTSRLDTAPIDSTRIIVRARDLTNGVGSMQVVSVSGSTIGSGSVVSTSSQNHVNPNVTMLNTTTGMYADQVSGGITQYAGWFSVAGTAITAKNENTIPSTGDFPSGTTTIQALNVDLIPVSTSQAIVTGTGLITNASVTSEDGIVVYKMIRDSDDIDVVDASFNISPAIAETTLYVTSLVKGGSLWVVYMDDTATLKLANYSLATSPTELSVSDLDSSTSFETKPEMVDMSNNISIAVYRTITASNTIKAVAMRLA